VKSHINVTVTTSIQISCKVRVGMGIRKKIKAGEKMGTGQERYTAKSTADFQANTFLIIHSSPSNLGSVMARFLKPMVLLMKRFVSSSHWSRWLTDMSLNSSSFSFVKVYTILTFSSLSSLTFLNLPERCNVGNILGSARNLF